MDKTYLQHLEQDSSWLPGMGCVLAAFGQPLSQTRYLLLGESPYPRVQSANGYAFWDKAVGSLWSEDGLSKAVNRATSLRNWIKALLLARGALQEDFSQACIAQIDKSPLVKTAEELFCGMMGQGILLLNACLVYSEGKVTYHARCWRPFMTSLLNQIAREKPDVSLILFGKIAQAIPQTQLKVALLAEHPYNLSFITNKTVLDFFNPLDLLAYAKN
jgi:uracil-DNA glycosylase